MQRVRAPSGDGVASDDAPSEAPRVIQRVQTLSGDGVASDDAPSETCVGGLRDRMCRPLVLGLSHSLLSSGQSPVSISPSGLYSISR